MLYIVATPIGNLEDMTFRAVRVLQEVDLVLAEDTRRSGHLLKEYNIEAKMSSFHGHTNEGKLMHIVEELKAGKKMALISDAGTPGVSDPAYKLVNAAIEGGVQVVPIPGACAFLTALSASGAMMHRFKYLGFLPVKKGRQTLFKELKHELDETKNPATIVLYEAPHRLLKTLNDIQEYLGERHIVIGRELTKKFEEFVRGTTSEVVEHFTKNTPKGEFVVIINGI